MNLKNDNEFENLFRRAADNFPLNTSGSDWESVLAKLEEKEDKKGFILINKKLLIGLIFLLLSIGGVAFYFFATNKKNSNNLIKSVNNSNNDAEINKKLENKIGAVVYQKIMDSLKGQHINNTLSNEFKPTTNKVHNNTDRQHLFNSAQLFKNRIEPQKSNQIRAKVTNKNTDNDSVIAANSLDNINTTNALELNTGFENRLLTNLNNGNKDSSSLLKNSDTTVLAKPIDIAKKNNNKAKFFYTGLMYATDKSSLKLNQNRGQGYSLAFVLGYQFNQFLSLESGLHIEKKEYYTTGENFNKSIIPATGNINWVEAENKLLEIPITLKYNFYTQKQHQFFTTFGLSSYLVNREFYEYEEEVNGVLKEGSIAYQKNTSNLFATYNFSIGYQLNVKKIGNFRLEPYINLPLKGTGLGKEPVISRGIYIGWIYNFKK